MTAPDWRPDEVLPTLAIGAAGAGLFWVLGFPAAVLTGPAAAVSLATLLGLRTHIPTRLRDGVFLVIGVSIGSTVTPEVLSMALSWPISLLALAGTLGVVLAVIRLMLMRGFRYDRTTALLAATPGHLSYVLGLSADLQADVPRVALVQSIRVLLLTLLVPVLITLWGGQGDTHVPEHAVILVAAAAVVFAVALPVGLVLKRLSVPAPLLLAGMAVSAIGHGANLTPGGLPSWVTTLAFVVMGSLIGTRFRGLDRRAFSAAFLAGVAATLIACAVAAIGAALAARIVDIPPGALLLAFAPGGVEVMAALAVESGLEPAFVAAHHVFRLLLLSALLPMLLIWDRR